MANTDGNFDFGNEEFPIGIFSQTVYVPRFHHHVEYEFFYLAEGRVTLGMKEGDRELPQGSALFIEAGTDHFIRGVTKEEAFHYYAIVFDISVLGAEGDPARKVFESIRIKRFLSFPAWLVANIKHAAAMEKDKVFGREILLKTVLMETLAYLIQSGQYQPISPMLATVKHTSSAIDSAIAYIKEHFRENITPEDVFSTTNYSKSHFSRLFKESVGLSITEFINEYRVEKACLDMLYTDKNITEIAMENGFNNIQYFSRVFKQFMKCSPKQYQQNARDIVVPSTIANVL